MSNWKPVGNGIYESEIATNGSNLMLNGVQQPLGRYPNTGYLTYEASETNTSITDYELHGSTNWTGAELVIRKNRWTLDKALVKAHYTGYLIYDNTKFVVCPYTDATQSGVLMTANAFNTPVVASSVGAFPEYVVDKKFGLLMKTNTPQELCKKMCEALTEYQTMSNNLEKRISEGGWANNSSKLLQAYES